MNRGKPLPSGVRAPSTGETLGGRGVVALELARSQSGPRLTGSSDSLSVATWRTGTHLLSLESLTAPYSTGVQQDETLLAACLLARLAPFFNIDYRGSLAAN
ncbi:hypothetical protein SCARD494_05651 [Seiridium cardinale]